ncbi:MAG: hypothetical protein PF961_15575 [Planctomycetota bacterium]|jgi:hypothetical protein|nr:hypothetical protein [Planctomycetota bacterium]
MADNDEAVYKPRHWQRMLVVQLLQLPAVGLVLASDYTAALWVAGLYGSVVCCAGTDSGWRWRNRLLVAQAAAWLLLPLLFAW